MKTIELQGAPYPLIYLGTVILRRLSTAQAASNEMKGMSPCLTRILHASLEVLPHSAGVEYIRTFS